MRLPATATAASTDLPVYIAPSNAHDSHLCGLVSDTPGVGGWAESGINPAEYSRTLMRVACAYIEGADTRTVATASIMGSLESSPCASLSSMDSWTLEPPAAAAAAAAVVDPRAALDTAHKLTKLPGSATACVVQLCPEKKSLIAANLVSACSRLFQLLSAWVLASLLHATAIRIQ